MKHNKANNFWELATGKLLHENSDEENEEFDNLLKNSLYEKKYMGMQKIHSDLLEIKPIHKVSSQRSWAIINNYFKKRRIEVYYAIGKYAAIILVAFFLGSLIKSGWNSAEDKTKWAEVKVPLGQMAELTLYDGSHVWLNSGTTLKYSMQFGKKDRIVDLEGEAFFEVEKDILPFKVHLLNSEVEVLGTSFNAFSYKDENFSEITLVEGRLKINTLSGEEIITIKPSQQIIIPNDFRNIKINSVSTGFYYSWIEGKIVFEEERLEDVALRLERWYNVDIRLYGEGINDLRFSGTILKNKPFDQIIQAFKLLLPVKVKYENNLDNKDILTISKLNLPMED